MAKRKIGLALSGGVGYCLAHIGVLKLIEQQGIEVDCVSTAWPAPRAAR